MKSLLLICLLLAACAPATPPPMAEEPRYLTLEEDRELRANCEPLEAFGGCVFMPRVQLEKLLRDIAKARAGRST